MQEGNRVKDGNNRDFFCGISFFLVEENQEKQSRLSPIRNDVQSQQTTHGCILLAFLKR